MRLVLCTVLYCVLCVANTYSYSNARSMENSVSSRQHRASYDSESNDVYSSEDKIKELKTIQDSLKNLQKSLRKVTTNTANLRTKEDSRKMKTLKNDDTRNELNDNRDDDEDDTEDDEDNQDRKTTENVNEKAGVTKRINKRDSRKSGHICQHQLSKAKSMEDKTTTTLLKYPYVVSIQRRGSHYATGALLDRRWVLSVAGEFYNVRESLKLFRVRVGSVNNKRGGQLLPLKRVVIHPSYVYGEPNFDVAILRFGVSVGTSDVVRPISMSKLTSRVVGGKFLTTYWPRLIVKGEILPITASERTRHNSLRVSTQKLIPPAKCKKMVVKTNTTLDDSTLCLKPFVSHHTVCVPDAGAPVVAEDGMWGVTSGWTSTDCKRHPSPYVFTRLSVIAVRAWLEAQMKEV